MTTSEVEGRADQDLLSKFGYKQELRRTLGLFSIFAISFSVISVTTGIFTNFAFAVGEFGPAAIWLWPVAAVAAMLLAFVLAELGSRIPLAGYSYQWGGRLVGPGYGWFVGFNLLCAFTLASGGETLLLLSPTIGNVLNLNDNNQNLMIFVSVIVLLLAGLINVVGVRITAKINNWSFATEILGTLVLGILVISAFLIKTPHIHGAGFIFHHGDLHGQATWYAASLALLMGAFTIGGFEACADLGEEAVGAQHTVARGMIGAVAISGVVGMITLILLAYGIPNVANVASSGTPIALIAHYWFGSVFTRLFLVTVVYSVFALMVVQIAAIGRLIYSLSRDNMFPASKVFSQVNHETRTPVNALVLTTLLYIAVMIYAAKAGDAYFSLIGATPIFASIVYLMIVGAYAARRDSIDKSPAFDLGKWAKPLIVISILWEIALIVDFTLPSIYHKAAKVAIVGQLVAVFWYYVPGGLRSRLKAGTAGMALAQGQLAGQEELTPAGGS